MRSLISRFGADRRGSVAVTTAAASIVLLGLLAIGVDGAHFHYVKRRLQAATDMAAMAAAASPASAASAAAAAMQANGFGSAAVQVTPGIYTADPTIPAADRFKAAQAGNAAEVIATTTEAFIFGAAFRAVVGSAHAESRSAVVDGFPIRTRAVARKQDLAATALGSGVAALDNGILNAVLGGLLGTRFNLSLIDYQNLAAARIDLFDFADALAAHGSIAGPTYGSLGTTALSQPALLNSLADSLRNNAAASAALRWIAIAVPPGASQMLDHLVSFGPGDSVRIGAAHPFSARVSALDMLAAVAQAGAQKHVVAIDLASDTPGQTTKLQLTLGEPMVGTSAFTAGPEGTTLHTAQARLLLTMQIGGSGLPAALLVPLYLELAPATSSIDTIACAGGASQASVTVDVTPGLLDAWIGSVQPDDFGELSAPPAVRTATLATVPGLVRIDAIGHVAASAAPATPVTFTAPEIVSASTKTVSSGLSSSALLDSLVTNTRVSTSVLGVSLPQPALPQLVTNALRAAEKPIDATVAQILTSLGVSIGRATSIVSGVRCGQSVLVD